MNWRDKAQSEVPTWYKGPSKEINRDICRKLQGKAEPGNACLTNPGTCDSCPDWSRAKYLIPPPHSVLAVGRQMNKTETRYASTVLEPSRLAGEIFSYQYEAITLKLGPDLRFTPDFTVVLRASAVKMGDGNICKCAEGVNIFQIELHETKGGFTRDDALVKIKAAAQQFPHFVFKLCRWQKGQWDIRTIA